MRVDIDVENDVSNVEIHSSDLWSLDYTLSKIIHPALVKFKEEETGSGAIDKNDVPEHLHNTYGTKEDFSENYSQEAWHWALDEMIWAFEQIANGNESEPFFLNSPKGEAFRARRENGLRLFGKYFRSLWN